MKGKHAKALASPKRMRTRDLDEEQQYSQILSKAADLFQARCRNSRTNKKSTATAIRRVAAKQQTIILWQANTKSKTTNQKTSNSI